MDDLVRQAMAKWPNVPACFGWLGLDARGNWWMRDDRTQALGSFQSKGAARGSQLHHDKLIDFIGRNYACEADGVYQGCWYFQNGPQRVYVELEAAPWIFRLSGAADALRVHTHTGLQAQPIACHTDAQDRVWLHTDLGFGLVHTQDVALAAAAIDARVWLLSEQVLAIEALGFVPSPEVIRGAARA
jgi:hypothetical protein